MSNETHCAMPRYRIPEFFSILLEQLAIVSPGKRTRNSFTGTVSFYSSRSASVPSIPSCSYASLIENVSKISELRGQAVDARRKPQVLLRQDRFPPTVEMALSPKVVINVLGDVGGWGTGSQLECQWAGLLDYRIKPALTLQAGYRYLNVDYRASRGVVFNATTVGVV